MIRLLLRQPGAESTVVCFWRMSRYQSRSGGLWAHWYLFFQQLAHSFTRRLPCVFWGVKNTIALEGEEARSRQWQGIRGWEGDRMGSVKHQGRQLQWRWKGEEAVEEEEEEEWGKEVEKGRRGGLMGTVVDKGKETGIPIKNICPAGSWTAGSRNYNPDQEVYEVPYLIHGRLPHQQPCKHFQSE